MIAPTALILMLLTVRLWQHWQVARFFRRPSPPDRGAVDLISIAQPILSGDPALADCLRANLQARSRYPREFLWLVDDDDLVGQQLCQRLIMEHPESRVELIMLPPPLAEQNPKTVKLIAAVQQAHGDLFCVLDDDTMLPDDAFDVCLPFLDQSGGGLVFGLPYYRSFETIWSTLVACFVNSHVLLTYLPYIRLRDPVTINGMFYLVRRRVLDQVGGFSGLETILADDFAVAQRFRDHGYRLVQTPLRHPIRTTVGSLRHYLSLMQRWFIFPRESLLRHLTPPERLLLTGFVVLPLTLPWLALCQALVVRTPFGWGLFCGVVVYLYAIFAQCNRAYLSTATPWRRSWWVLVLQFAIPLQLLIALFAPQQINWRGHRMEALPGGGLRFVRRRTGE